MVAAPAAPTSFAPIVAFEKGGLRVQFAFDKPSPADQPGLTTITSTSVNNGLDDMEGFTLSVSGAGGREWVSRGQSAGWGRGGG